MADTRHKRLGYPPRSSINHRTAAGACRRSRTLVQQIGRWLLLLLLMRQRGVGGGGGGRCSSDAVAISHGADRMRCAAHASVRPQPTPLPFADPRGAVSHEPRPKLACHYPRLMSVT